MTVRCKVFDITPTTAKIIAVSNSASTITATCDTGTVVVGAADVRYNVGGVIISSTLITITGLPVFTQFTYSVSQDAETRTGSPTTSVNDQTTDFGYTVATCDRGGEWDRHQRFAYTAMRKVIANAKEPITNHFHIDDLFYADSYEVNDSVTGIATTGKPQSTGLGRDYAAVYATYFGLLPSESGWRYTDRIWFNENQGTCASGGDHAIELNHCRGALNNGVPNPDYSGCNRLGTDPVPNLEATAKAEWDAFVGQANPPMLRTGKWHWGKVIGSIRFALFDYSLYSQPYDSVLAPDVVGYGSEQLADIRAYMNVNTEPFKCFFHESGVIQHGQPWRNWHQTEADAWKAEFDATVNYMTAGTSWTDYGDNHAPHVVSLDTFWGFCAGMIENSQIVNQNMESEAAYTALQVWGGQNKWSEHAAATTGDRAMSGFWHVRVLQSETPKRIERVFIDGGTGEPISPVFTLLEGATNNQWTMNRPKLG